MFASGPHTTTATTFEELLPLVTSRNQALARGLAPSASAPPLRVAQHGCEVHRRARAVAPTFIQLQERR